MKISIKILKKKNPKQIKRIRIKTIIYLKIYFKILKKSRNFGNNNLTCYKKQNILIQYKINKKIYYMKKNRNCILKILYF